MAFPNGLPVTAEALLAFLALSVVVLVTPGPSLLLIAATTLARGRRAGLRAVLGTTAGLAIMVAAVVAGLGTLLGSAGSALGLIRWAGVAWLLIAGGRALAGRDRARGREPPAAGFWAAFAVSALNPATTPFLVALLPQFVDPARPAVAQLATFGCLFVLAAVAVDTGCALLVAGAGNRWRSLPARIGQQVSGLLLLTAALLLAVARSGTDS